MRVDLPSGRGLTEDSEGLVTLSAVVINYNHGHYLAQCIQSLLQQTRCPDEIIIVDDASTDDSREILKKFENHPRIRVFANKTNEGAERTVNFGFQQATSTYVFGLAADDYPLVNFVERSMAAIERHPGVGVVCSVPTFQDEGSSLLERRVNPFSSRYFSPAELVKAYAPSGLWIAGHTSIVRRDLLLDAGGNIPELRWHSDWFALHCIGLRAGVYFVNEALSVMRRSENSYSSVGKRKRKDQKKIIEEMAKLLSGRFADVRSPFLQSGLMDQFPYQKLCLMAKFRDCGIAKSELRNYFHWDWTQPRHSIGLFVQFAIETQLNLAEKNKFFAILLEAYRSLRRFRNEIAKRSGWSWQ